MKELLDFINQSWILTRRYSPEDEGTLIGLPKPYTVPSIKNCFNELYYWDTYFTNVGLIISGKLDYAKDNADNIAHLINKYGFMPNGNRTYYLNRSQPPFFSLMVRDIYDKLRDREWLSSMFSALLREYSFWQDKRSTPIGLNRYYHTLGDIENFDGEQTSPEIERRLGIKPESREEAYNLSAHMRIVCESGWDCNSRMGNESYDYAWVDLNSLMYAFEMNMAYFASELSLDTQNWIDAAERRRALMKKYCYNTRLSAFCDYNFKCGEVSDFISLASFYPLFCRLATKEEAEAAVALLPRVEFEYGLAASEMMEFSAGLQWDYPNGWAPLHYMVINGLLAYGYSDDALRIARKYCRTVEDNFMKTGNVWEKYNVITGEVSVTRESAQHEMMGWSAGVYLYCKGILGKRD